MAIALWAILVPVAFVAIAGHVSARDGIRQPARAAAAAAQAAAVPTPEARAVAYLAREVPRWRAEHPCHSCHNNGDAARALLTAVRAGFEVGDAAAETVDWLDEPEGWERNATEGGVDNKPLARIQFAGALAAAVAQQLAAPAALAAAAELIAGDQRPDGSWRLDSAQNVGTPVTYGTALATWAARRVLVASGRPGLLPAIARADAWFRGVEVQNVLDAAAVTLGLEDARDPAAGTARERALDLIRRGEAPRGGWGPYTTAPPEAFDTAVVVLALRQVANTPGLAAPVFTDTGLVAAVARGRAYLVDEQLDDGSWIETTRPANQESYAQRLSTTGWAAIALLATGSG